MPFEEHVVGELHQHFVQGRLGPCRWSSALQVDVEHLCKDDERHEEAMVALERHIARRVALQENLAAIAHPSQR